VALPVDSEDYLMPSPQSPPPATPNTINSSMHASNNNNKNPYMDLISDKPGMFVYPPPHGYIPDDFHVNYGRLVLPDFIPHGVVSMDNPEYILQESKRRGVSNYQTLGIPIVPSPTSSLPAPPYTPTSLPAPPYTSLSSQGSGHTPQPGLNGAIPNGQIPRSSDGESDHEYYNDVDRLQREMQPLHVPRNETTV